MKFYHQLLQKPGVPAVSFITSGKQMNNNYAPYFNIVNYVIYSYIELAWDE